MASLAAETWDEDEDFDLSNTGNLALELPRSDTASHDSSQEDLHLEVGIDSAGASFSKVQINAEDGTSFEHVEEDWDNDDIDEDQVDTIKFSDLTSTTLAQLASFRKQTNPALDNSDLASLSLDGMPGKVINMGSFAHISTMPQDGSADWDQDLEMPESFSTLQNLRDTTTLKMTTEIDLELEAPSYDSTSDATTSIRSTSDTRKRSPTQSSFASKDEQLPHSSSPSQCSLFEPRNETGEENTSESFYSAIKDSSEIESSFHLPETVTHLNLASHLVQRSAAKEIETTPPLAQGDQKKKSEVKAMNDGSMNSPRYLNATAASKARRVDLNPHIAGTSSRTLARSPAPRVLRVPKRAKDYGDGRELDSIADLPVSKRDISPIGPKGKYPLAPSAASSFVSPAVERANRVKGRRERRVEPTLIRNLGAPCILPRIVGSMTWNPALQRWEGNEEEGKLFEKAVKVVERRALTPRLSSIGHTKSNLASTRLREQLQDRSSPIGSSSQLIGAKVVGDMIFDPIKLCWLNKNREDEVDPFAVMEEEEKQLEQASILSIRPSKARVLSTPATTRMTSTTSSSSSSSSSFHNRSGLSRSSQLSSSGNQWSAASINRVIKGSKWGIVPESLSNRIPSQLWLDSIAAKDRHDEEMAGFIPSGTSSTATSGQYRRVSSSNHSHRGGVNQGEHLYLIQSMARKSAKE